jgi:TctA family transporter
MKPAIITALILTAYAYWIDKQGGNADWRVVAMLIVIFSGGIGYFFRSVK